MKNDIVAKIDFYIDNNLYTFPYLDDVKEALKESEREKIWAYSDNLKQILKYINANLTKQERERFDFTPKHIKQVFDTLMFDYYYEPFYEALTKLLVSHGGYAANMIDEFMFHKSSEYGVAHYRAGVYRENLETMLTIARRNEAQNQKKNGKR